MWKAASDECSPPSPVPSSLPPSSPEAALLGSPPTRSKWPDSSIKSSIALSTLTPYSHDSSIPHTPPSPPSLSLPAEQSATPLSVASQDPAGLSSLSPDGPRSADRRDASPRSRGAAGGWLFTDAAVRAIYKRQPPQLPCVDPYTLYCAQTSSQQATPSPVDRQTARSPDPPASPIGPRPLTVDASPAPRVSGLQRCDDVPTSALAPTSSVLVTPVQPDPRMHDDESRGSPPPFCTPFTACASMSLDLSFVDLPSQLHRLRDSQPDDIKDDAAALGRAALSLSYQSTPQTSTMASQRSHVDTAARDHQDSAPFPRLSASPPLFEGTESAFEPAFAAPPQPQRRVGAFRVEQIGVLLPNMQRSALIPAQQEASTTAGVTLNTLSSSTTQSMCGIAVSSACFSAEPAPSTLPAASSDLLLLHTRMHAALAALTRCGCRPYHVRVLHLALSALETLCKTESLFASRSTLALQTGCTRDVLQWADTFDVSAHNSSCRHRLAQLDNVQQAEHKGQSAGDSMQHVERHSAKPRRDERSTQGSELVRHNSCFSYPSTQCTA